jgi:hypothetical protein
MILALFLMLTFSACIHKSSAFQLAKPSLHSFRYNNRLSMSAVRVTTYNVLSSHLGITWWWFSTCNFCWFLWSTDAYTNISYLYSIYHIYIDNMYVMYTYVYLYIYIHICIYTYVYIYIYTYLYIYIYLYVYIYIYIYVYIGGADYFTSCKPEHLDANYR